MKLSKGRIAGLILALFGVLALALGFAAAFGDTVGGKVNDAYNSLPDGSTGDIASHIKYAFVGGIISGVFGLLALGGGVALIVMNKDTKVLLFVAIGVAVVLFALSVAAIVCQGQLNDMTWVINHTVKP